MAIFGGIDGTELHGTCTGSARELHESLTYCPDSTESNGQRQSGHSNGDRQRQTDTEQRQTG